MKSQLIEVFNRNLKKPDTNFIRKIGLECEFPLVDTTGNAIRYYVLVGLFKNLESHGFELHEDQTTGEIIYGTKFLEANGEESPFNKIVIGTDAGYCTLEVAFKPESTLFAIEEQFNKIIELLIHYFNQNNAFILGYGIQPITQPSKHLITRSGRYNLSPRGSMNRFVDQRDGVDFHLFTISASNQCHIEIGEDEAIRAINVLNGLSGLQIALTANSSVWRGEVDQQWKAVREIFWDWGFLERWNQSGIQKRFRDIPDYIDYLCSFNPFLIQRDDQPIYIIDKPSFGDYLNSNQASNGILISGEVVSVFPEVEDILYHSNCAWFNTRISPKYGTIESRISCQQPPQETLVVTALVLGIVENIEEAENLLNRYSWDEWKRFRFDAIRHTLQAEILEAKGLSLVAEFTRIAETGLRKRGLGEEKFLEPAFKRIEERSTPADRAIHAFQTMKLEEFINSLAFS